MQNKDIQQIRINVVEVLLETCKDDPDNMYGRAENYLKNLKDSLIQNNQFYEQQYRG